MKSVTIRLLTLLAIISCLILPKDVHAQESNYPKIGLALSGGGAKGLAHIIVCKALDSAGLHVDYVTGTSMGAIIGSTYAAGHKGKDVEKVAYNMDWSHVISDNVPIRELAYEEKDLNLNYAFKIPFSDRGLKLDRSFLEGQGVWYEFTKLLFPVMGIDDFSELPRGFKCIGTELENGDEIILEKGNILESVRASMAIPAVFTPIQIGDTLLVDGGLVRNFPVQEVIDMGSDFVIGIDVNHGGRDKEDLRNPLTALLNIGFYNSNKDFRTQKPLCDYYFEFDMHEYNTGSFDVVPELMDHCNESLDSLYHVFKGVKDSLDAIYGPNLLPMPTVPDIDSYYFTSMKITGLSDYQAETFKEIADMSFPRSYTQKDLQVIVDEAFSSNRYKSIYYNVNSKGYDEYEIEFKAVPRASGFLNLGLQYSSFEGINVLGLVDAYDLTGRSSRTRIGGSIGKNFRLRADHIQPFTKKRVVGIRPYYNFGSINLRYDDEQFDTNAEYKQIYSKFGIDLIRLGSTKWQYGLGWRMNRIAVSPDFYSNNFVNGHNTLSEVGIFFNYNRLNRSDFPTMGTKFKASFDFIYKQQNNLKLAIEGQTRDRLDDLGYKFEPYQRLMLDWDSYFSPSRRGTFRLNLQTFANFSYTNNFVDYYLIGGLEETFRNQITFAGINESSISTFSFAGALLLYRYQVLNNLYLDAAGNFGTYGFIDESNSLDFNKNISGFSSSLHYKSFIGTFRFALAYSPKNNNWASSVYFGKMF